MSGRADRLTGLLPAAVILLAPMAMLYPLWANPVSAGEDDVLYYYPTRKLTGRAIVGGWRPWQANGGEGTRRMADPQAAVWHPTTWLFAGLDAKLAYSLSIFAAMSLAGGGAYLYLRRIRLVRPAATLGALAFMFCGFTVGHRVHLSMLTTAAMLPWGLWCIEGFRRPNGLGAYLVNVAALTAVAVVAIAAGHLPILVYMAVAWGAYLLIRVRPLAAGLAAAVVAGALAALIAAPQLLATRELLAAATRERIGYATAGENSFFPPAAVLALFPMIMGSRTPNLYPQPWWGPWHLCEMLGYVGLATLVLAGAAVWRLYRKGNPDDSLPDDAETRRLSRLVRCWTWIAIGAGVWMLGYYLPTYRIIHALPVLGVVRCPARMVLVADMSLATLAAVATHAMIVDGRRRAGLARTIRRGAMVVLPAAMLATLALLAACGALLRPWYAEKLPFFVGGAGDMLRAVVPGSPAGWIPLALAVLTAATCAVWAARPARRWGLVLGVLVVDLFFVARFVDVPSGAATPPDPERSPAAAWLDRNAPADGDFRVWGLSRSYHHRPAELLLPETCEALGYSSIAGYGPFQSPAHAHLLGFRIYGTNRNWARLLRRNYLLSLYGVRYVLAADAEFRRTIESVRTGGAAPGDGENLLGDDWRLDRAGFDGGVLRLRTPALWLWSQASQEVRVRADTVYRIALDARGPDGGAANFLRAELFRLRDGGWRTIDAEGLRVESEQVARNWRHFEWVFRTPPGAPPPGERTIFRVFTMSERPIEVRNVSLRAGHPWRVVEPDGRLGDGERVYRQVAELPARDPADAPVAIYENRLYLRPGAVRRTGMDDRRIEMLKWQPEAIDRPLAGMLPALVVRVTPDPRDDLLRFTLPAGVVWAALLAAGAAMNLRRRRGR